MKAVVTFQWKIVVGIVVAIIAFAIIFLIMSGVINGDNLSKGAAQLCHMILDQVQKGDICDMFVRGG
jgi:hypothetical protein